MTEIRDRAKLGLAFAIGVSLSAGYVAVGQLHGHAPKVVVVEERCPGEPNDAAPLTDHGIELAPLPGEVLIPEGFGLWVGLDGVWLRAAEGPVVRLAEGTLIAGDVDGGQIPALRERVEAAASQRTAVLWIDHRVPGATVAALLTSLRRAGIDDYALAVAGADDQPRGYRFGAAAASDERAAGGDIGLGLSLRSTDAGAAAAWIRPVRDGQPMLGGPSAQPLDLGPLAPDPAAPCVVSEAVTVDAQALGQTLAAVEADLCQRGDGQLSVEYALANLRPIGELLALRAAMPEIDSCRLRSSIAAPGREASADCTAALTAADLLGYLDTQAAARESSSVHATITGLLDKDAIRAVVRAEIADIRSCYDLGLARDPQLAGRVVVEFVIAADGQVASASVGSETTLGDPSVAACMVHAIEGWTFPSPARGEVKATYPFILEPG